MSKKRKIIMLILTIGIIGITVFFINDFIFGSVKGVNQTIEKSEL